MDTQKMSLATARQHKARRRRAVLKTRTFLWMCVWVLLYAEVLMWTGSMPNVQRYDANYGRITGQISTGR